MPQIVIYGKKFEEFPVKVPTGEGQYWAIRAIQLGAKYATWPTSEDCPPLPFCQVGIRALAREQAIEKQNGSPRRQS